jgi:ribonuclease VapC
VASAVLDASALLAYLHDEPGADAARVARQMTDRGLLDGAITVEAFTSADAVEVGRLRPLTREHGLSLGERACLALARRLALPAVTADTAWAKLDLRLELRHIR